MRYSLVHLFSKKHKKGNTIDWSHKKFTWQGKTWKLTKVWLFIRFFLISLKSDFLVPLYVTWKSCLSRNFNSILIFFVVYGENKKQLKLTKFAISRSFPTVFLHKSNHLKPLNQWKRVFCTFSTINLNASSFLVDCANFFIYTEYFIVNREMHDKAEIEWYIYEEKKVFFRLSLRNSFNNFILFIFMKEFYYVFSLFK